MNYYDLHVHSIFSQGESTVDEIAKRAELLGFRGICFVQFFKDKNEVKALKKKADEIFEKTGFEILIGLEAETKEELKELVNIRRDYDILLVRGFDLDLNLKAVKTREVDILTHPEFDRKDSGLNHTMVKLAAKNNVAIEVNFREILTSSKNTRSHVMHNIEENIKLCRKYKAPIIICSGAYSHWQMKDPKILISMGNLLGLDLNESKKLLSEVPEKIICMIREKQDKNWIRPGVKVVK